MTNTNMYFDIFGRDKGVGEVFDKVAGKGNVVTKALGGISLAAAGLGLKEVFQTGYEEASQAAINTAQLEAGIKSTGGAAGVTVGDLKELASSIQEYSGQTDDSITKTESLLLTFTNIKNQGPDKIFDEATRAAADMAAKFGGDASEQAIVLGKALNDPVRGLTALRRIGIQFTESQEAQIKAMVASGDTMGAQKIILGELSTEFGGAAEAAGKTLPGQLNIAKRTFEDISENLVTGLLPVMQNVMHGVQGVMNWFKALTPEMQGVVTTILTMVVIGGPLVLIIGKMAGAVSSVIGVAKDMKIAWEALNVVMNANMFAVVILAIAALVASLIWAYNNVGWFKDFVDTSFHVIGDIISTVIAFITGVVVPSLIRAWTQAGDIASAVTSFISDSWNNVSSTISSIVQNIISFFQNLGSSAQNTWNGLVSGVQNAVGQVGNWFASLPGRILGAIGDLGGLLLGVGAQIIGGLTRGIQGALGGLGDVLGAVGNFIAEHKGPEEYDKNLLVPHGGWIMGGLIRSIGNQMPALGQVLNGVGNMISGAVEGASVNINGSVRGASTGAAMRGVDNVRSTAVVDLNGMTVALNADATKAMFQRTAGVAAQDAIRSADDDIYRGRAR